MTIQEILAWADRYHAATGRWPTQAAGAVVGAKFENWAAIDQALRNGLRGLPAVSSLRQLLAERRGVRNSKQLPPLTVPQILAWADAFQQQTGGWPAKKSGLIPGTSGDRWQYIDDALRRGRRGLPGGSSLPQLLAEQRGVRNQKQLPPLTEAQILAWADAHHTRTGRWPAEHSGAIAEAPGESWRGVENALRLGYRALAGGSSLALFLAEKRAVRNRWTKPNLSIPEILCWADAFHARTGVRHGRG